MCCGPGNFALLCVVYAASFAGGGFVGIFMPVLLSLAGLDQEEVGLVAASSPVAGILGVVLLGWLFDKKRAWRKGLYVAASAASFAVYLTVPVVVLLVQSHAFSLTVIAVMLAAALSSSAGVLLDAIAVETTKQNEYGKLRLFGAVGYGIGAAVMGVILYLANPEKKSLAMWLWHYGPAVVTNSVGLTTALFLKSQIEEKKIENASETETDSERLLTEGEAEKKKIAANASVRLSGSTVASLVLFGIVVLICGVCSGVINAFLFVFLSSLPDGTGLVQGVSVTVTTAFEIPVFFFSKWLLDRISVEWLVSCSLLAYCLRLLSYFLFAMYRPSAYYAFLSEVTHGLTFALLWAATVARVQALVKSGKTNSGIGMAVASCLSALGRAAGSFGAGAALKSGVSFANVWLVATASMGGIFVIWTIVAAVLTGCRLKREGEIKGL